VFVEDVSILYRFALEGLGVALTQRKYAHTDLKEGRMVAPHPFILRRTRGYHLMCPAERAGEDKIRRFREWLLARAAEPD
jgi:LysR family glycine cleavage system transcriptional activator